MSFFSNFPQITYNNKTSRNIILKSALISDVLNRVDAFYPYIIKEYERPDQIAYDVYDDSTLDWVVYFSNSIIDPYYQWPLTDDQLKDALEKKYNKTIYELQSEVHHYVYTGTPSDTEEEKARITWTMTPETYAFISPNNAGWTPVYTYDYESELNDSRRSIKLLNKFYIPQIQKELNTIFSL